MESKKHLGIFTNVLLPKSTNKCNGDKRADAKRTPSYSSDVHYFSYLWTNLGPIPVELNFKHIMCPENSKAWILRFLTNIVIIGPTIAL